MTKTKSQLDADIARELERSKAAQRWASVSLDKEAGIVVVITTRGDLAGSHSAAHAALKKAGLEFAKTRANEIWIDARGFYPMDKARTRVAAVLRADAFNVSER